ncbi:S49 family peptidase [Paraburkholderia terrae]|uniref:S49 family peptidase n=1 Tax=Paraburkholderia terrae TaxID=311230 RepID=UPI00296B19B2|nr:S49 family peptidase [Paraburkholderia terrae]MDW3660373.1 S49 family peptidase [Paraburkholderia terrae]
MHYSIAELLSAPWAILPERLAFVTALLRSAVGQDTRPDTTPQVRIHAATNAARRTPAGNGAIAVLRFHGIAVQRTDELGEALGLLSLARFAQSFRAALVDDSVAGILLDVDSPGGSVYGIMELADEVWRARGRKPVFAVANSLAASGAYWIASSAAEFYVTPGGEVGGIGVVTAHLDMSQALEKAGVKTTLVSAGRYKLDGHPARPLGEDARKHVQSRVDEYYGAFVRSVARNRGVALAKVRNGMGQGRLLDAQRATREGMVDDVATIDMVVRKLAQRIGEGKAANASRIAAARQREIDALARQPSTVARRAAARQRLIELLSV